jgi:hypothetical protein
MINKVIHYCWFGNNELSSEAKKCIESWKKYCPDYKIIEWNERNFNINICNYVRQAYQNKKWAFVSDYARFWIIYNYGGIYFDTDVELIKPLDNLINEDSFMGCEKIGQCAPGLGIGANKGNLLYKEVLDYYNSHDFVKPDGSLDLTTVVVNTSTILKKHNWKPDNSIQTILGTKIYPPEYFNPMDYESGKINITENTYSIHHYASSWLSTSEKRIIQISRWCKNKFGEKKGDKIGKVINSPYRFWAKVEKIGIKNTMEILKDNLLRGN